MAPNRYFTTAPQGALDFMTSFLTQRQRVHEVEAGMDAAQERQDQALWAQAGGNIAQRMHETTLQRTRGQQAGRRQQASAASAQALEMLRQQGRRGAVAAEQYDTLYPGPPPGIGGAPPPSVTTTPTGAGGPTAGPPPALGGGGAGAMPSPGTAAAGPMQQGPPTATVPRPAIDPASISEHKEAFARLDQLKRFKRKMDSTPMTTEERANQTMGLVPEIARLNNQLKGVQRPKQPTTAKELVAGGHVIPMDQYGMIAERNKDGSYTLKPQYPKPGTGATYTDTTTGETQPLSYGLNRFEDGVATVDAKGKVNWDWKKETGEFDYWKTYDDHVDGVWKANPTLSAIEASKQALSATDEAQRHFQIVQKLREYSDFTSFEAILRHEVSADPELMKAVRLTGALRKKSLTSRLTPPEQADLKRAAADQLNRLAKLRPILKELDVGIRNEYLAYAKHLTLLFEGRLPIPLVAPAQE